MSGFCGWVGIGADPENRKSHIERMGGLLSRLDGSRVQYWINDHCALAVAPLSNENGLAEEGGFTAAVEGFPEFHDERLAKIARASGNAVALLRGYREHGPDVLRQVHGGFSLVILEANGAGAFLAIDRIGGRFPLSYRSVGDGLIFGTKSDTIQQHPQGRSTLDRQAIYNYLYFHVVPGPRTARTDVVRLGAGNWLRLANGSVTTQCYWTPEYVDDADSSLARLEGEFREILECSVKQAAGQHNVGCFLSGGTDSSTLAGMLMRVRSEAPTFSIGFDAEDYDEMSYARIAARHFGTLHHEYYLQPDDIVDLIPRIAQAYSEPFGNESAVPAYYCARMAQEHGLDLLLGGDGGDELFAGNSRYSEQELFELYARLPRGLRQWIVEPALSATPGGDRIPGLRKLRNYVEKANTPMPDRTQAYVSLRRFGPAAVIDSDFLSSVDPEEPMRLLRDAYQRVAAQTTLNRMLGLDLRFTLADNDLPKVSVMCELAGLPVRYPFLSDEMIGFSLRVPARMKMKGFRLRWFFKHALRDFLPREVLNKTKHGMGTPFGLWMRSHRRLEELALESLKRLRTRGIVRADFVDEVVRMHRDDHAAYYGVTIWALVQLEHWLTLHTEGYRSSRPAEAS